MTKLHSTSRKIYVRLPIASGVALALLGLSPATHAAEVSRPIVTMASSFPTPPAVPTHEQMQLLHQMDPALHAGMGHRHGPHAGGAHDCTQSADSAQAQASAAPKSATVNGTLSIKTSDGTRTIVMTDVMHGGEAPCVWPVGGSIALTGADSVAHSAIFAAACGHVTLDGAQLVLPTKHEHPPHGGHHQMGQGPKAPDAKP